MTHQFVSIACLAASVVAVACAWSLADDAGARAGGPVRHAGGTLVSTRFESGPLARPDAFAVTDAAGTHGVADVVAEGTIDTLQGRPTPALKWTIDTRAADAAHAVARLTTAPLDVTNAEAELGRLTLGFDLWVSQLRPVRVRVSSLRADGAVGGSVVKTVVPPVAGAFYRFSPDLGSFTAADGTFDPRAGKVCFGFELAGEDLPLASPQVVVKIDNLSYAAPAFYVSPAGRDSNDGRTEATAFATPQHAVQTAGPGDVILVGGGTYVSADRADLVYVEHSGEPDRWIVLRAAPGQTPIFRGTGWNVVNVGVGSAYVEFRGLTIRGYADEISIADAQADEEIRKKNGEAYPGDPRMNTNGFALDGRKADDAVHQHHLRFIDNTIRFQSGAGIALCAPDHVTIEGNVSEDNCHPMRYASSGISILSAWNYDADENYKLFIVGNRSARNQCFVRWSEIGKISDGNGIIIDQFIQFDYATNTAGDHPYLGRTLVQNNLVYGNGGSGIHAFASNHVDIVNNTAYHNAQSPELNWRQIFAGSKCRDIRIVNNVLWAQSGKPIDVGMGDSKDVHYDHNLIYGDGNNDTAEGGGLGTSKGGKLALLTNAVSGVPRFVRPSIKTDADFHLVPGSPQHAAGTWAATGVPLVDIDGSPRLKRGMMDVGAYVASDGR